MTCVDSCGTVFHVFSDDRVESWKQSMMGDVL